MTFQWSSIQRGGKQGVVGRPEIPKRGRKSELLLPNLEEMRVGKGPPVEGDDHLAEKIPDFHNDAVGDDVVASKVEKQRGEEAVTDQNALGKRKALDRGGVPRGSTLKLGESLREDVLRAHFFAYQNPKMRSLVCKHHTAVVEQIQIGPVEPILHGANQLGLANVDREP